MKKALFIDFDDSFTWNVVQELEEAGLSVDVIHWMDFEILPKDSILVLGPGPGHPDDYQRIFPLVSEWLSLKKPFLGICLGHQIFWRIKGEEVYRSRNPVHGQRIDLSLTLSWQAFFNLPQIVKVQRYNSLSVYEEAITRNPDLENLLLDGEIMITRGENSLSYQFHPESVGTSYRQSFFRPLLNFEV